MTHPTNKLYARNIPSTNKWVVFLGVVHIRQKLVPNTIMKSIDCSPQLPCGKTHSIGDLNIDVDIAVMYNQVNCATEASNE